MSTKNPRGKRKPKPPYRVQILCETAIEHFRDIKLAIRRHALRTGRLKIVDSWFSDSLYNPAQKSAIHPTRDMLLRLRENLRRDRVDGVIAQIKSGEVADMLAGLGVPVVEINDFLPEPPFPVVTKDWEQVGRQAARHLADCGGTAFGFWGIRNARHSRTAGGAFRAALAAQSREFPVFATEGRSILDENGVALIRRMEKWMRGLPKPLGIFAIAEVFGLHLIQAAENAGLRIPDDVAILAGSSDPYWTDFGDIPLSSIRHNASGIGAEAALLMDKMITRGARDAPGRVVGGSEILARQSTDVLFIKDNAIRKAVAHIRANAGRNLYVADVARAAGISQSGLHARFRAALGRSVLAEIRASRVRHVRALLRTTDLPLAEIAEACEFPHTPALHMLFRRATGQTPAKYRALFRRA